MPQNTHPEMAHLILTGMPRLMSDLLRELAPPGVDVDVVDDPSDSGALLRAVDRGRPSFVIAGGCDGTLSAFYRTLMERLPGVTVLSLSASGRHGWLFSDPSHSQPLNDVSPRSIRSLLAGSPARDLVGPPA
jgi:hypothetical protein